MSPLRPPDPSERPVINERLRKMVERWPSISGYRLNPYPEVVEGIVQALTRSTLAHGYPYCPCREVTGDRAVDKPNTCPCEHHHGEIVRDGHCKCVLFVREGFDVDEAYRPEHANEAVSTVRSLTLREITMYMTQWCFISRRSRALLDNHGVPFEMIDFERDPEAAAKVESWNDGNRSSPTIITHMVLTEPMPRELSSILETPGLVLESLDVYMTQWCGQSRRIMNWLSQQGIPYMVHDIDSELPAARRVQEWNNGNRSVPTLDLRFRITEPTSRDLERAMGLVLI